MPTRRPFAALPLLALAVAGCSTLHDGGARSAGSAPVSRLDPAHPARPEASERPSVIQARSVPSSGADAADATAFWARFDVTNPAAPALGELGLLGAEDLGANTFTSYANVAVNPGGHALFGFAASSSAQYEGAYFRSRAPGDAAGATGATKLLQAGTDFYVRTFGGGRNRWGDYSGAAVDPKDGCFWVYNEHAATRGTPTTTPNEDGRWETSFGRVCPWLFGDDFERGDTFRWSSTAP